MPCEWGLSSGGELCGLGKGPGLDPHLHRWLRERLGVRGRSLKATQVWKMRLSGLCTCSGRFDGIDGCVLC